MSAVTGGPRSPEQRSAENARFRAREAGAGIVRMAVAVPVDRIPHLRALLVEWRREAKMLLESDLPTSDQILQIHAVCRTLRIKQPIEPAPRRRLSRAPIATDRAQEAFLADLATAYDRATPYFEAAHNGSKVDQHSARGLLYRLTWMAEHGTEIDERWIARTKAALKHPALSGYAKEFLTALK